MGIVDGGGLPAELLAVSEDARVIAQLAEIFRRNSRHEDGAKRYLEADEAAALARQALERLFDPHGFQLADVGGIRFYLELGSDLYPGPNQIHANAWDGTQWRPIGKVLLPGGQTDE